MSRSIRVFLVSSAVLAVAAVVTACGTERIAVSHQSPLYSGAVLFNQRCGGCHTLSYAATHGSAPNVRTAQANSGPNLNLRCERPLTRVLYAIENGGFSGAYMPQNIVVGQDALNVAKFVSTYAGRQAPQLIGIPRCQAEPVGTVPPASATPTATIAAKTTRTSTAVASTPASPGAKRAKKSSGRAKKKSAHS